jgi:hypothetical protein
MTDETLSSVNQSAPAPLSERPRDYERARAIVKGTQRLLRMLDFESLSEVCLANGRRADVLALRRNGEIWIVEVKSSIADFRADQKWQEYRDYCDALSFAVAPDFPAEILPAETGLILADAYGGELIRPPPVAQLSPARRKALTLAFARTAACRLHAQSDPQFTIE